MSHADLRAEWITRFRLILDSSIAVHISPVSLALRCSGVCWDTLIHMYAALCTEVPSDMLRHRIHAEVRAMNGAMDLLQVSPIGRIDNRWPALEYTINQNIESASWTT